MINVPSDHRIFLRRFVQNSWQRIIAKHQKMVNPTVLDGKNLWFLHTKHGVLMGYMMAIQWDSMGFDGIYDGIAFGF